MELEKLNCLLEERSAEHDENRKEVQGQLEEVCSKIAEDADLLEEKLGGEIRSSYEKAEERIIELVGQLENPEEGTSVDALLAQAQTELLNECEYAIVKTWREHFVDRYALELRPVSAEKAEEKDDSEPSSTDIAEYIVSQLQQLLDRMYESMAQAQLKLSEICEERRKEAKSLNDRVNTELEPLFMQEEKRIQRAVNMANESIDSTDPKKLKETRFEGGKVLFGNQTYSLVKNSSGDDCKVVANKKVSLEAIHFTERSPQEFSAQFIDKKYAVVSFSFFSEEEVEFLKPLKLRFEVVMEIWKKDHGKTSLKTLRQGHKLGNTQVILSKTFSAETTYCIKAKLMSSGSSTEWSDTAEFTTPDMSGCGWKECLDAIDPSRRYRVDEENPRIVTKNTSGNISVIVGNVSLRSNKVNTWNVRIVNSQNNGGGIYIGVASLEINQNNNDYGKCGWYFNCCNSYLIPDPFNKASKNSAYRVNKRNLSNANTGDTVGVIADANKGEISFVLNGVNLGVAYENVHLSGNFVPCVVLANEGDSVELVPTDVKENVDSSIPAPSNITAKSGATWDVLTFTWDVVDDASFYRVMLDDELLFKECTATKVTKKGLLPDSRHTIRIQTVKKGGVSEWSDVVEGRTKKQSFKASGWKEYDPSVNSSDKYYLDEEDLRIVTYTRYSYCTIIGNTPIPLQKVTSWSIKLLNQNYSVDDIFIGVAPSDIDQNEYNNDKCGWYFSCRDSTLISGPPHDCRGEWYGPRKTDGNYVHSGDSIGVVMDTKKGELSFSLNKVGLGVAYKGIPLDKPLVPCVIPGHGSTLIKLCMPGSGEKKVEENTNALIPTPSNLEVKCTTWNSVTLAWNKVNGATSYKVEVNGNRKQYVSQTNAFTVRDLAGDTSYTFRVCAVKGKSESKMSTVVEGRTAKVSFLSSVWKECPSSINKKKQYSSSKKSPRVTTKTGGDYDFCTIIGNAPLPSKKVASWSIRVLRSKKDNGNDIYIGVAPADVNQDSGTNHYNSGWYYCCYSSSLVSGPPHSYKNKGYGIRGKDGEYVHSGDTIGVVMDTKRGELSFALNGINLGIAYKGIPLDKPLVPCVILGNQDDSIELII